MTTTPEATATRSRRSRAHARRAGLRARAAGSTSASASTVVDATRRGAKRPWLSLQPDVGRVAVDVEEPEHTPLDARGVIRRELLELDRNGDGVTHDLRIRLLPRRRGRGRRRRGECLVDELVRNGAVVSRVV